MQIRRLRLYSVGVRFFAASAAFAIGSPGGRVYDALVEEYLSKGFVGHINRDSTAIMGREKSAKKVARERRNPRKPLSIFSCGTETRMNA